MSKNIRVTLVAVTQPYERKAILGALENAPGYLPRLVNGVERLSQWSGDSETFLIASPDLLDDYDARHPKGIRSLLRQFHIVLAFQSDQFFEVFRLTPFVDGWLLTDRTLDKIAQILSLSRYGYIVVPPDFQKHMDLDSLRLSRLDQLSDLERHLLLELSDGKGNQKVADAIGLTGWQAKSLIRTVFKQLQFRNRTEAAVFAAIHETEIRRALN